MLELRRQAYDHLFLEGDHGVSLIIEDRCFTRLQFGRDDRTSWIAFFERLGSEPPDPSRWSQFEDVVFLWDRPDAVVAFCEPAVQQWWWERLYETRSAPHEPTGVPAVTHYDGLVLLVLEGGAVDDLLSSLCSYDFHRRSHAHAMTTRLGDVRVRLLLEDRNEGGRRCRLIADRSHVQYLHQLTQQFLFGGPQL